MYVVFTRVCMIRLEVCILAVGTLCMEYRIVREGAKHIEENDAPNCKLQSSLRVFC